MGLTLEPVNKRYTGAANADVLFTNDRSFPCAIYGLTLASSAGNTLNPDVKVKVGSSVIGDHPGVPAGGGFVVNAAVEIAPSASVTLTTTDPGGTLSVTFYVDWNPNG